MGTGRLDPKGKRALYAAIAVSAAVIMLLLTVVISDEQGQIRTDLQAGDYYTLEDLRVGESYTYRIDSMDGDTLTVTVTSSKSTTTIEQTKEKFLSRVYASDDIIKNGEETAIGIVKTFAGDKLCHNYNLNLSSYLVDEYRVIYYSTEGGVPWRLVESSLINQGQWLKTDAAQLLVDPPMDGEGNP